MVDGAGTLFRPIRGEPIGRSAIAIPPSPTASLSPSNVTGRGGTRSDYRQSTRDYVDSNANSINNADYGKSGGDDRLVHLIDKLHIDKSNGECQSTSNHIGAVAVAPALLLANHITAPVLPSEKLVNGDVKPEVSSPLNHRTVVSQKSQYTNKIHIINIVYLNFLLSYMTLKNVAIFEVQSYHKSFLKGDCKIISLYAIFFFDIYSQLISIIINLSY